MYLQSKERKGGGRDEGEKGKRWEPKNGQRTMEERKGGEDRWLELNEKKMWDNKKKEKKRKKRERTGGGERREVDGQRTEKTTGINKMDTHNE